MGGVNDKMLIDNIAKSPAVQNIVHKTAMELARVLSASVIAMCKEIVKSNRIEDGREGIRNNSSSVQINIQITNFNSNPYQKRMKKIMKAATQEMEDCMEEAEIVPSKKQLTMTDRSCIKKIN